MKTTRIIIVGVITLVLLSVLVVVVPVAVKTSDVLTNDTIKILTDSTKFNGEMISKKLSEKYIL